MLSLESSKEMDQHQLRVRIIAAADVHLQYMQELEAEPSRITGASAEPFLGVLAELPPLLCTATFDYSSQAGHLLHDAGLILSPGILNAAILQAVGLGKYLHSLHVGKQSQSSEQGPGGGASSSSSSSCSPRTSSRRPAKVIGASSFAQLELRADHGGIRVVGGGQAVAAVSRRLERQSSAVGNGGWNFLLSWDLAMAVYLFRLIGGCCPQGGSSSSVGTSSGADSRCTGGRSSSEGGCTGGGMGGGIASSSGNSFGIGNSTGRCSSSNSSSSVNSSAEGKNIGSCGIGSSSSRSSSHDKQGGCDNVGVSLCPSGTSSTRPQGDNRNTTGAIQLGSGPSAPDMATYFLGAPLLQLLLELQALVGSFQLNIVKKSQPLELFLPAQKEATVALLSARGALLLQVLWLMAENSNRQQQEGGDVLWLNVLRACHLKVLTERHASNSPGGFWVSSCYTVSLLVLLRAIRVRCVADQVLHRQFKVQAVKTYCLVHLGPNELWGLREHLSLCGMYRGCPYVLNAGACYKGMPRSQAKSNHIATA